MYLRKAITLQADDCHNLDPRQMICISLVSDTQSILMYHSTVLKVKKIAGLSFSKLSFKEASAYMLPQSANIC